MRLKFVSVLCVVLMLLLNITAFAQDDIRIEQGIENMKLMGFSDRLIEIMDTQEIIEYSDVKAFDNSIVYQKMTVNEDNELTTECYTEAEYLEEVSTPALAASNTTTTSWMKLKLTSAQLSGTKYKITLNYTWLSNPIMRLKDVVAITCDTRILPISGTESSYLYWDDGSKKITDIHGNTSGIYAITDIPGWGNDDMNGYLSFSGNVQSPNASTVYFTNWGYYAHQELTFTGSGSVGISGLDFTISPSGSYNTADVGLQSSYTP